MDWKDIFSKRADAPDGQTTGRAEGVTWQRVATLPDASHPWLQDQRPGAAPYPPRELASPPCEFTWDHVVTVPDHDPPPWIKDERGPGTASSQPPVARRRYRLATSDSVGDMIYMERRILEEERRVCTDLTEEEFNHRACLEMERQARGLVGKWPNHPRVRMYLELASVFSKPGKAQ